MEQMQYQVDNGAGWDLDLRRFADPDRLDRRRRPLVCVPGYCMNCFILGYHPSGISLIEYLVGHGYEVWAANLRGQGRSTFRRGRRGYGFADLALVDLPAVLDTVGEHSQSVTDKADLIGCSLGATISYVYLAHHAGDHRIGALVNIGGPLRWNRAHPVMRLASQYPMLYRAVPIRGVRHLARWLMPVVQRFPWLLSHYMNPSIIDLSRADRLVQTIDDPDPQLTAEIAQWVKDRDLVVEGLNISHSLYSVEIPIQCVVAMQDGIVTPGSALSVLDHIGSHDIDVVEVGSAEVPHAHADLFVSNGVEKKVFEPVQRWLTRHNGLD